MCDYLFLGSRPYLLAHPRSWESAIGCTPAGSDATSVGLNSLRSRMRQLCTAMTNRRQRVAPTFFPLKAAMLADKLGGEIVRFLIAGSTTSAINWLVRLAASFVVP